MSDAANSPGNIPPENIPPENTPPEPASTGDIDQLRFRDKPARFWAALRNQYFGASGEDDDGIMTGTSK